MKKLFALALYLLILLVSVSCASTINVAQELLVTDYGYFLNGEKAVSLASLDNVIQPERPIKINACHCADTVLVVAALDWVKTHGAKSIAIAAVETKQESRCGVCK